MRKVMVPLNPALRSEAAERFCATLSSRVIGQDEAVAAVAETYQMFLAGLNPPHRPVGNLLFLGPTGSGKTRVVEAVAEVLFGTALACLKIDCAEFQHSHEIAKLIGSPPGYLGHRETHALLTPERLDQWQTEEVKLSLLLFDEIEKASDSLWQLLLGILDKATLTLGDNRQTDLSRCLIFMTSNLGAAEMTSMVQQGLGFGPKRQTMDETMQEKIGRVAKEAARRKFSPEFMNRIDKVVVFRSLVPADLEKILDLELALVQQRVDTSTAGNRFQFYCSAAVKEYLLKEGTDARYGARHLKRAIERHLVFPLANLVATGQIGTDDSVEVELGKNGVLAFTKHAAAVRRSSVASGGSQ